MIRTFFINSKMLDFLLKKFFDRMFYLYKEFVHLIQLLYYTMWDFLLNYF